MPISIPSKMLQIDRNIRQTDVRARPRPINLRACMRSIIMTGPSPKSIRIESIHEVLLRHCFGSGWVSGGAPKDLCHFVGTTKQPKHQKAESRKPFLKWPTWDWPTAATNWAIFRLANGLKVLDLRPYILRIAAIISAFYQPKFKGFFSSLSRFIGL